MEHINIILIIVGLVLILCSDKIAEVIREWRRPYGIEICCENCAHQWEEAREGFCCEKYCISRQHTGKHDSEMQER